MIIFDLKKNTCERFEPYGSILLGGEVETLEISKRFDIDFGKVIKKYIPKMIYFTPFKFCPEKSFQFYNDAAGSFYNKDPGGFCAAWSFWWADLRLKYPNIDRNNLLLKAKKIIEKSDNSFKQFIRNYSNFVIKQKALIYKNDKIPLVLQRKLKSTGDVPPWVLRDFVKQFLFPILDDI